MLLEFASDLVPHAHLISLQYLTRLCCIVGPISEPGEAEYVLKKTKGVHGFYGASSLERLPVEQAITATVKQYKAISIS